MNENNEEDFLPLQYLNNENPYAFCKDYGNNKADLSEIKDKLNALHKLQPSRLQIRMNPQHLDSERNHLLNNGISLKKSILIKKGLQILNIKFEDVKEDPEDIFEKNLENEEIIDIAIELKKLKLIHHQMRLRARVSHVLQSKIPENVGKSINMKEKVTIDNLKEGLIFVQLYDLCKNKEN